MCKSDHFSRRHRRKQKWAILLKHSAYQWLGPRSATKKNHSSISLTLSLIFIWVKSPKSGFDFCRDSRRWSFLVSKQSNLSEN